MECNTNCNIEALHQEVKEINHRTERIERALMGDMDLQHLGLIDAVRGLKNAEGHRKRFFWVLFGTGATGVVSLVVTLIIELTKAT